MGEDTLVYICSVCDVIWKSPQCTVPVVMQECINEQVVNLTTLGKHILPQLHEWNSLKKQVFLRHNSIRKEHVITKGTLPAQPWEGEKWSHFKTRKGSEQTFHQKDLKGRKYLYNHTKMFAIMWVAGEMRSETTVTHYFMSTAPISN